MKKVLLVLITVIIILISLLGFTYSYEVIENNVIKFSFKGPTTVYIEVNEKYEEYGIKCEYRGNDITNSVIINSSKVDTSKIGEYKVKYSINIDNKEEYVYRIVKVIDTTSPLLTLKGEEIEEMLLYSTYIESGYISVDNYDGNITEKVTVEGNVNTKKEGEYILTYTSIDSSKNKSTLTRKIIVKKPIITLEEHETNIVTKNSYNVTKYSNTIYKNNFTKTGVYYEGYIKNNNDNYKIKLKNINNRNEYIFNMEKIKNNYYKGNLDFTTVINGTYDLYIISSKEEKLQNGLSNLSRIIRSKVNNKLLTFTYDNNYVRVIVEDFKYQYDFVIDPGHGGKNSGAANGVIEEKNMNLKQSLYEKCRYESMGYKVYMTRYDDTYGEMLGNNNISDLERRALTIGYYGSVSRVVYSNHHNAVKNTSAKGFEILVANDINEENLLINKELYNRFLKYYNLPQGRRIYSRDFNTGTIYDKTHNEVYSYTDYYAVIRIPHELFNTYVTIYEPIYISNTKEFNWYWINKKYIDITEIKIETYVNYLGGTYNSDNTSCLYLT